MRPLKLTMTAFGPYRQAETIDFAQLDNHRLFVISGNTGAGKTSVFDAICFALYGSASGEDRSDPRMLRSHFADDDTHTAVELDFAVRGRQYRVFRQMKHRKGSNKSETGERIELYEITGGQAVPAAERFMAGDVNARLLDIIGLTKDQFSQIVMLPQGEFRKLLTSDTDNKEEILRRIFRTELIEKLELQFQRKHRELQDGLRTASAEEAALVKAALEAVPLREGSGLAAVAEQPYRSSAQVLDALRLEAGWHEEQARLAALAKAEAEVRLDGLQVRLREAMALRQKHDELADKRLGRQRLEEVRPEYEAMEKRLALAAVAASLKPYDEQAGRAEANRLAKQSQLVRRREALAAAERAYGEAAAASEREAGRETLRRESERELHRLNELAPAVMTLDRQRQAVAELERREAEASARVAELGQALEAMKAEKSELQAAVKSAEAAALALAAAQDELRRVEQQGKLVKRLLQLGEELRRFAELESAGMAELAKAKAEHDELERRWVEGQAALLAAHLHDGKPCPVCGSESHPAKAQPDLEAPSRASLQQAKERLAAVERELMEAKAQAAAAAATRVNEAAELEAAGDDGGFSSAETADLADRQAALRLRWKELKERADRLQQEGQKLDELRSRLDGLERKLTELDGERESRRAEQQRLLVERTAQASLLQKELERIPEELRSPDRLQARLREQKALSAELETAWKRAQEALSGAAVALSESRAYAEQAAREALEAEESAADAAERFRQETERAGFPTAEHYRNAMMPEAEAAGLRERLESYKASLAVLEDGIAALERELEGRPRPDIEPVQEELGRAKLELEEAIAAEGAARRHAAEAGRLAAGIERIGQTTKELEARLERVSDLYGMLKGDNALKLSFERYILREYLEDIIAMANIRLSGLSNGQFQLRRSDRLEARGKQSGLGLDVFDAYTGMTRDVKTLSGGEKFNASLSLALGMTDVIQSYQGGISIEMMLIDEGFGSLDEESLHKAISALADLQRSGRMIGVISHVQELKDAFPACLEVWKDKDGSSRTRVLLKERS